MHISFRRLVAVVLLSWLTMSACDLLQHAGLFAQLWIDSKDAFLPPEQLFQRLPLGYLSFLLSTILLTWVMLRIGVSGGWGGTVFGLKFGLLLSAANVLGMASGFPVTGPLLVAIFFGGIAQYAIVAAIAGSGLAGRHLGWLTAKTIALVVVLVIATVVLQQLGFAPAMQYTQ